MSTFILKLPQAATDTTLPLLKRDKLLEHDNGGVKALIDLAFPWCNPGTSPLNGATIKDVAEVADHSVVLAGTDTITAAGGGFDFSTALTTNTYFKFAVNASAAIWADANQYFMICMYLKLPALADWNVAGGNRNMLTFAATNAQSGPDLLSIAQIRSPATTGSPIIQIDRQYAAATVESLTLAANASDPGSFAQIAFWRNASGSNARLRTANGIVNASSTAHNVPNTQNFSALQCGIGTKGVATVNNFQKYRLYRAFIESLTTSGRDPVTVLDADYARTVARAVYS